MIEFVFRFNKPLNILIFLLVAVIVALWAHRRFKNKSTVTLLPFVAVNFALLLLWAGLCIIDHDEVAHLHLSWLVSKGFVPYKDFWQHHPPLLWVLLASFMRLLPKSPAVFDISRAASGSLFLVNAWLGWQVAKQCWQGKARMPVYLLLLSSGAIYSQFLILRPDNFMILFLLSGIYISFKIAGRRLLPSLFAGIAFGLAAAFIPKQYLLFILPFLAVFTGEKRRRLLKLALYLLGLAIGCLPLLAYLISSHILKEYVFWVFNFNRMIIVTSVYFPLAIAALGGWGACLLLRRLKESMETKSLIVLFAFCLSTLSSITTSFSPNNFNGGYNLAFWTFACAISASGCDILKALNNIHSLSRRAVITGILFSALIAPAVSSIWNYRGREYQLDKSSISSLMKYSAGGTCLAILQFHPVFAIDATRIYSFWQFYYAGSFFSVKNDARRYDIASQILTRRPEVVLCRYHGKDFILELFQKRLIFAQGYKKLVVFLKENYTQKDIGKERYYIRNDKLVEGG